ncbi:hypothetical protein HPB47_028435 [Ixodes persulcatus]|uniref:Uncharacterized protein n=1 Tax=Ixodes persulcatus TaxID=34615 RepID=A0AC60PTB1_IXOPE|nr:hypothetical protein HPB47_028435 [Ixodes persulcatus]
MDGGCSRRTDDKMDTQSFGIPLLTPRNFTHGLFPFSRFVITTTTTTTPRNGVVEVEGEEITPEEFHSAGGCWRPVLLEARAEKKALSLTAGSQPNRTLGRNNGRDGRARIKKTPRIPKLPQDDAKIVFRLRGGLNVRKEDRVLVQRSIQRAAQLSSENAGHDAFRFNEEQNTLIVSTPALENAVKYGGVHSISLKGQTYEVVAYAIPPDDTIKGVIHGIPDEDSEQDVLKNLVTAMNPNVLHARRMGRSKTAVVLFKGQKVPFWIMYGNVELSATCTRKRSKYAVRAAESDIEPTCALGRKNNDGHACSPSCGICCKAHPTGDTRCKQRFKTPYILKQRQWEKKKKEEESRLKEEDFPPGPARGGRSRSRRRSSFRQRVSWAGVTDHKASEKKSKLDEILVLMRQLQEENKALRVMVEKTEKENVWLRTQLQQKSNETEKEPEKASPPAKRKLVVRPGQETVALDKAEAPLQQEVNKQVVELMCNPEWLTQLARHMEQLRVSTVEHVLIEIISGKKKDQGSLFVLNIYSSPAKRHRFASLYQATLKIARRQTLVVVGDFNAPHPDWGYKMERPKGRKLWIDSHECGLSLITDPDHPTRRGDARQQDTTPDLTFVRYEKDAEWTNTWEDLGSDHYVLKTMIRAGPGKPRGRKCKITEWNKFRELLGEYETEDVTNIGEWMECLLATAERTTKVIPEEADVAAADSRLLHLWEAKASLQERQRTQRNNRSLRRRIAQLSRTIETYADQVTRQQWQDTCDGFGGQPNVRKTWNILLHLLDMDGCKTAQRSKMCEIIRSHKGDEDDVVEEIRKRYIGDNPPRTPTTYGAITGIMKYINECWRQGQLTLQWKTAKVVMIPKPGTKPQLDALRPISLTSCVGKIMEHVVLRRISDFMERNQLFLHTMVGFRPHRSTQDVMLRLKHQIIDGEKSSHLDTRVILGLDLTKAFETIRHDAVLENLEKLGAGRRTFNLIQDFLSDRTAQISIGGVTSDDINLGGRGTPQGSVLLPYLFKVAMIELPAKLSKIEGLHHNIYADDITLWMTGGRDGFIQDTLQEAIRTIEKYVTPRGLTCSPQKSELLLLKPVWSRQLPSDIALYSQGLSANGNNYEMIESLKASTYQITRLISRISGRHFGMKENNLVRLVRAFVVSRLAYVLPFLRLGVADKAKLDCSIRKAYKRALGILDSTSNEKLAALGLHNTVEEIVEAQRTSQLEWLTKSATGCHILEKLGIRYERQTGEKIDVPKRVREKLTVPNLPRHMHPVHHVDRRTARAKALRRLLEKEEGVYYTDAARFDRDAMAAAVVDKQGKIVASCSVRTTEPEVAEEVAIALALKLQDAKIVVSDSQMAIRQYAKGRISPVTLRVLGDPEKTAKVKLISTPAHSSLPGNEEAHDAARGLTLRAGATSDPSIESLTGGDRLVTFRDIIDYYAGEWMRYPPAHPSLDKIQEVAWRRLQTGTYPSPAQLSRWYPDRYKGDCQLCGANAMLHHIVWECSRLDRKAQPLLKKIPNQERCEALLLCTDLKVQEQVVRLAKDAAGVQGILAVA